MGALTSIGPGGDPSGTEEAGNAVCHILGRHLAIEEFDEEIVEELRNRARDVLLTQAIVQEEKMDEVEPAEDLLGLEGMDRGLAFRLASNGIVTREDLAELATDDLLEINEMSEEAAAALIMKARAHWFEEEQA